MIIRKATYGDLPQILSIYQEARTYMKENGNPSQWGDAYPPVSLIEEDLERRHCYVCVDEQEIIGVFCYFAGTEPTYEQIYQGHWLDEKLPYGVIHRIAVAKHRRGVASACFDFALRACGNLRIDTHRDNLPMQASLAKNGFTYCGIIYLANGEERLAYQKQDKERMPQVLTPKILYEDKWVVLVEKPVGMPSQPDHTKQRSVLDYLQEKYGYAGLVHRLDTPTGGVMLFSRHQKYTGGLCNMFSEKERMQKYYLAVLPSPPETPTGEMIDYLYHDTKKNKTFVVDTRRGATHLAHLTYEVLATNPDGKTLVKVRIYTGRSHQIRAQFAHVGLPLLGDGKYGSRYKMKPQGFALWAYELQFEHPHTKETLTTTSLPPMDKAPWSEFSYIFNQ